VSLLITVQRLIAAGVPPTQARQFAESLAAACARFDITTPARVAGFVAQCRVESADFTRLEENLHYTTPERIRSVFPSRVPSLADAARLVRNPQALANRVYQSRLGNGPEASGDGWRYRGRGIVQLTGRANYADAAEALARPYVEQPELVALPADACLTAAWYWHSRKLSILADSAQWDAITRAVNGPAMLHADLRRQHAEQALTAFA
jgi:putative chitinase